MPDLNKILITLNTAMLLSCLVVIAQSSLFTDQRLSTLEVASASHHQRLSELELRQTNSLQYLEGKVNRLDEKLDTAIQELRQSLKLMELRTR